MIDWTGFNKKSPAEWTALAQRLISKAHALMSVEVPDRDSLRSAQADLGEFIDKATLRCPESAVQAAAGASSKVTLFLTSMAIDDLESREDKFELARSKLETSAEKLRADAAMLALDKVRKALVSASSVANEVKALIGQVESMTKADIPGRIEEIAKQAAKVVKEIESGVDSLSA